MDANTIVTNYNTIIKESKEKILREVGDKGTCVMGMALRYNGATIATQIAQGSITNENYFHEVKMRLITELNYDESRFSIEWGRMD